MSPITTSLCSNICSGPLGLCIDGLYVCLHFTQVKYALRHSLINWSVKVEL